MPIKNNLKEILDSRGIKYAWLAEQANISRNTVSSLIKGSEPKLTLAYRIAKILNLNVSDIWPPE